MFSISSISISNSAFPDKVSHIIAVEFGGNLLFENNLASSGLILTKFYINL